MAEENVTKVIIPILRNIGINEKAAKLYEILLHRGMSTPTVLAKITGYSRSACYEYMRELHEKGLVNETKLNNKIAFISENPKKILKILEAQERNLQLHKKLVNEAIDKINFQKFKFLKSPKVRHYTGLDGIKQMYNETLDNSEKDIKIFFGGNFYPPKLKDFIMNEYIPARVKKDISCKVITSNDIIEQLDLKQKRERKKLDTEIKTKVEINIYDNKTNFVSFLNDEYTGVILEHSEITNAMKEIFNLIWNEN